MNKGWALVTGASAGLGVEFARQLVARGYDVVLTARRRDRLEKLAAELTATGARAHVVENDLSVPGAASRLLAALGEHAIAPDVLVNNAGVGYHGLALDQAPDQAAALLHLNVTALTELALAIGAEMAARGKGAIVNVSSTASFQPMPFFSVYAASKAYVTSFSLALARELAPRGVHVVAHCPGPTTTEFNEKAGVTIDSSALSMSAARCVAIALRAMERRRSLAVTGWLNKIAAFFARRTPLWLVTRITAAIMRPRNG